MALTQIGANDSLRGYQLAGLPACWIASMQDEITTNFIMCSLNATRIAWSPSNFYIFTAHNPDSRGQEPVVIETVVQRNVIG
jgi:hypothetical protein